MLQRKFSLRCEITHSHGSSHSPLPLCFTLPGRFRAEVGMDTQIRNSTWQQTLFICNAETSRSSGNEASSQRVSGCCNLNHRFNSGFTVGLDSPLAGWIIIIALVPRLLPFLLLRVIELLIFSVLLLVCLLIFCRQLQLFPSHRKFHGNWKS